MEVIIEIKLNTCNYCGLEGEAPLLFSEEYKGAWDILCKKCAFKNNLWDEESYNEALKYTLENNLTLKDISGVYYSRELDKYFI